MYVRRSSSTAEAGLDEVLKMKSGLIVPTLDLQLADVEQRQRFGKAIQLTSEVVNYDESTIPVYERGIFDSILANENYERDLAELHSKYGVVKSFGILCDEYRFGVSKQCST